MAPTKKIVIIGASYAGFPIAKKLEAALYNSYQVVLIDKRDHFFHNIAALRGATVENLDNKLFVPYTNLFKKNGQFIHGNVTEIRKNAVVVSQPHTDGNTIVDFDYLVIATGSSYPAPAKVDFQSKEEGVKVLQENRASVAAAERILIIGGGPVGIELAGEILTGYPKKNVTLIHNHDLPITDAISPKGRQATKAGVEKLGVKLVLGDSIIFPEEGLGDGRQTRTLITKKGLEIESDLQFVAFGVKPNSSIISTLDASLLNPETNCIRVKPTFQLPGYDNIFAIGDVADMDNVKLAYKAGMHADVVAKNIIALANKKGSLKEYKQASSEMMLITLGKNGGVAVLPGGIVAGNMFARMLKSSTVFVDRFWKDVYGSLPK